MVVGEVVKCLEAGGGIGVEGDTVLAGGVQVFECMNCGFEVLLMGSVLVRC